MLSVTELVINRGVNAKHVASIIVYLLPDIISFGLPAASLMAVVVAFLRFSSDSEIIAMKSSGISIYQMLPPVIALSVVGFLISLIIGIIAVPWGNRSFKDMAFKIAQTQADLAIKERIFCEPFDDIVFYVSSFSPSTRVMEDVFVVDWRDERVRNTIVAREGMLINHPEKRLITVRFKSGTISIVDQNYASAKSIDFKTYDMNVGLEDILDDIAKREKDPKELTLNELIDRLRNTSKKTQQYNETMIELLEKFSIPFAVLLMGIIGVPLGAHMKARGRTSAVSVSLVVFFLYYVFLAAVRSICETGSVNPLIGMWIPPLFLLASCLYLLKLSAIERSIDISAGFSAIATKIMNIISNINRFSSHQKKEMISLSGSRTSGCDIMGANKEKKKETEQLVGNIQLRRFHRSQCRWAQKISADNRAVFLSREDATEKGFEPCKVCKP
jgi:lipopolysaccharide export system permease protein